MPRSMPEGALVLLPVGIGFVPVGTAGVALFNALIKGFERGPAVERGFVFALVTPCQAIEGAIVIGDEQVVDLVAHAVGRPHVARRLTCQRGQHANRQR